MLSIVDAQLTLDILCGKVSLARQSIPHIDGMDAPPVGAAFWSSDYACVLLWPIVNFNLTGYQEGAAMALDFLDSVLSGEELLKKHVDGYLVLALENKPTSELDLAVRTLELSTNICRKHTIWLDDPSTSVVWSRISDISVLGLPDMTAKTSEILTWPTMSEEVKALWLEIGGYGVVHVDGEKNGR